MRSRYLALMVGFPLAATAAVAKPMPSDEPRWAHVRTGVDAGLSVGLAGLRDRGVGWMARLELAQLQALPDPGRLGGLFGIGAGVQAWAGDGAGGAGLPMTIMLGVRSRGVRGFVQLGFESILVDRIDRDVGVGLMAPLAGAQLAIDVAGWHAGVDARIERRWQFGAADRTQWQLTIAVAKTWESDLTGPVR